jgi:hypothetical protein
MKASCLFERKKKNEENNKNGKSRLETNWNFQNKKDRNVFSYLDGCITHSRRKYALDDAKTATHRLIQILHFRANVLVILRYMPIIFVQRWATYSVS